MTHTFSVELAELYGVDGAVFLSNIYFWIVQNEKNGKHFYDGKTWTYNSINAMREAFPYWSAPQIRRIIDRLEDAGALFKGNYNKKPYDKTTWYALNDDVISMLRNQQIELTKSANGCDEIGTPIPDINTDNNTDKNKCGFDSFWEAYPRKTAKSTALKSWMKIKPDDELREKILASLEQHKQLEQWRRDNGQYIPHASTWLNQRRWEDELPGTTPEPQQKPRKGRIIKVIEDGEEREYWKWEDDAD